MVACGIYEKVCIYALFVTANRYPKDNVVNVINNGIFIINATTKFSIGNYDGERNCSIMMKLTPREMIITI